MPPTPPVSGASSPRGDFTNPNLPDITAADPGLPVPDSPKVSTEGLNDHVASGLGSERSKSENGHDRASHRLPGGETDARSSEPGDPRPEPDPKKIHGQGVDTQAQKLLVNATGWAGIESHLFKHDTEEMKYYAEDIDTLLVFAGLFSAFLTAFVVQTYPMLTDDDSSTTNQLLALSVSAQLRATGTVIPSTINSTLTSLLDAQLFSPATSARAINILFFLSLILSLAAAFFGILAKQWLREYLRWNSPLALPRENVLVRQDRIEAWEAWNVAATISSIPALLELAMVLFLSGVVVLLWTLDDVVAIIITVFAALFLVATCAFTLLPVIYRRCPYKSPTAWACVAAYQPAWRVWVYSSTSLTVRLDVITPKPRFWTRGVAKRDYEGSGFL
ncbi:hypothetical protein PsYK624_118150 [Phanerochaete sordida]|uniref:DUF6535 domain-containing protein n=1 Tax=Phanerochaete sordida TaxID=48140 RepID=A0A9P3GLG4_9APHY|nr:hypothetical protein PsYK624_118150 [Phanerochaete sordida]